MLFLLHISRNEFPEKLLADLRKFYPLDLVLCISDGDISAGWGDVCDRYNTTLIRGSRLKPHPNGGKFTDRWMRLAAALGQELIIKIDADCQINRVFKDPPNNAISGHLACRLSSRLTNCRGGAAAYQRSALIKILESDLLLSDFYLKRSTFLYINRGELLASEDQIIADVMSKLGLSYGSWGEVFNIWYDAGFTPIGDHGRCGDYAILAG